MGSKRKVQVPKGKRANYTTKKGHKGRNNQRVQLDPDEDAFGEVDRKLIDYPKDQNKMFQRRSQKKNRVVEEKSIVYEIELEDRDI